jgi:hypothetical protein
MGKINLYTKGNIFPFSLHGGREGEAPRTLFVEGATQAPSNREPPGGTISIYFGGKSWFGTPGAKRLYFVK